MTPPAVEKSGAGARFREALCDSFRRARAADAVSLAFELDGRSVQIQAANPSLVPWVRRSLIGPLRETACGDADLTILIWDQATTGEAAPVLAEAGGLLARGDVRHGFGPDVHVSFSIESGTLQYLDTTARLAACWVRDPARILPWESAAPLRSLLGNWATHRGGALVHAAGVSRGESGLLIAGPSGSGKSTTTIAALEHGFDYLGDDFVLVIPSERGALAQGLYCSAKLTIDALARWPELGRWVEAQATLADRDKLIFWPRHKAGSAARIAAIVLPEPLGSSSPRLERTDRAAALRALLPSSTLLLAGAGPRSVGAIASLVQGLPVYRLGLSCDLRKNGAALEALLGRSGARASTALSGTNPCASA